ncbi:MAG TPA: hypothetical protein VFU21_13330 [Kofleriaceae bacterium]|nr:hypothetical protein [Kofleriaceae bacterium]
MPAWLPLVATDRVAAMRRFLEEWYGPLGATDGIAGARLAERGVPPPLRALHEAIGNRPDLLKGQNAFLSLDDLAPDEDGWLTFYVENQDCFRARVDPRRGGDAEVFLWDLEREPVREREPLSGYLLQAVLFEAMWRAPWSASCIASDAERAAVIAPLERVPLAPWRWPGDPCELFVGPVLIAMISRNGSDWYVVVGARSRQALRYLRDIDAGWEGHP